MVHHGDDLAILHHCINTMSVVMTLLPEWPLMQPPGLMLLRVSAYWGLEYPRLKKALVLTYTLCTMATAALQMVAVSKIYRTLSSHSNHRQNLSRHYSQPVQVLSLSQLLCNSAPQDNGAPYSFSSSLRGLSLLCQAAYYAPYLFMEIILFVLTFRRWFIMRKSHPVGVSIIHIFFRDGMIYFAVIFGAVSLLVCEPE